MRRLQLDRYSLLVVVVIGAATLARVVLIALGPPYFDSDEGTTGLMALHIAHDGAHPAFFYGQSYMGALEAYLAVPTIRLFGVSVFGLRLGLVPLFVLFVITEYLLVKQLYNRRIALLLLPLLSLGSQEVWSRQLKATGGSQRCCSLDVPCSWWLPGLARGALTLPYCAGCSRTGLGE